MRAARLRSRSGSTAATSLTSSNPDTSETLGGTLSNLIYVTQTVTDGDGDIATQTAGSAVTVAFADDGPTAGFTLSQTTSVTHDESAGLQGQDHAGAFPLATPVGAGALIGWAQSAGPVIATDTSTGGADGKASDVFTLTNVSGGAINNVDSGLKATATGNEIFLFTEGGLIVGRELNAGGAVAFAIGLDGSNQLDVVESGHQRDAGRHAVEPDLRHPDGDGRRRRHRDTDRGQCGDGGVCRRR